MDIEAQPKNASDTQPAINPDIRPANTAADLPSSNTDRQPQATNTSEKHTQQTADNSDGQSDENHGDSSNGLWSLYLTEAEKQDKQLIDRWKGDTDGILVFTGLFSATVAAFLIENYQNLSPNPGDTTNALLTQISQQLVNISNNTPLTSIVAQGSQPFKPTPSTDRINVLWFLSLVLSLNCALSATLMQQWARRYQEFAQRRNSIHKRGSMRAYIFNGINRFRMARAVSTMPMLLHISVFLFFAGLVDFLFPTHSTIAYVTLGVFAVTYTILTVLPTIYHDCPYGTPLSGSTWFIFHFSFFATLWTILQIDGLFRKPGEILERQVKAHRKWFSQGLRKSAELSAYKAKSTLITSALAWTLTALDEDKEIEDFAAQVPGFFDSRVVPDPTSAVLPLMSHQPNTGPIFGSRLYDLLKTCIRRTSLLDENIRNDRLRACLNCLWHFGRAYNQLGTAQLLPSYFPDVLASPEIIRCLQEEDTSIRVIGRCFAALVVNKLAPDLESRASRADPISPGELACLSAITQTESHDVVNLLSYPGAIALANIIVLKSDKVSDLADDTVPPGVLDVVQQTLNILSPVLSAQKDSERQRDQSIAVICGLDGKFEDMLASRIHGFLNMCIGDTSPLKDEVRLSCLRMCFKGLWYFSQMLNQPGNSVHLPSYIYSAFPVVTRHIHQEGDLTIRIMGHCIRALVINKLAINIKSYPVGDPELACLSAILDTERHDVKLCLSQSGAVELVNMAFPTRPNTYSAGVPLDVQDVVQQTFGILSMSLPPELIADMGLYQADTLINAFNVTSSLTVKMSSKDVLRACMKNLWHFTRAYNEHGNTVPLPSYLCIAFINPEMTRRIYQDADLATQAMLCCVGALVVNNLAANINSRKVSPSDAELACLSAILATKRRDTIHLLQYPSAIELTNMVFLALNGICSNRKLLPPDVSAVVQWTFGILSQALPPNLNAGVKLNGTDTLTQVPGGNPPLTSETDTNLSHLSLRDLWRLASASHGRGSSVPLPHCIFIAFTNPEMARRIFQSADLTTQVIGRCVGALVVAKLTKDLKLKPPTAPASDWEHTCLATIFGTESRDVRHCLNQPGTVELVNMASTAFSATRVPPNTSDILHQTLDILSEALLETQEIADAAQIAPNYMSDDWFKDIIVSRLHGLFKLCRPRLGTSSPKEEVRSSCLRMCLKVLWHSSRAYHQGSDPLPIYFHRVLASPDITHLKTEQDPVIRTIGRCVEALVLSKLVNNLQSKIAVSRDTGVLPQHIWAILGEEHRDAALLPYQLHIINFRDIVSLLSGEIDVLFPAAGTATDMVEIAEQTLTILAERFKWTSPLHIPVSTNKRLLLSTIAITTNAGRPYRLKDEMVATLNQLQEVLKTIPE